MNLAAWQKADQLALKVYQTTTQAFPKAELFGLTSQLRRAAISIAANIAEGYGRDLISEDIRFLRIAKGSLSEVECYIHIAKHLGYLDEKSHQELFDMANETARALDGYLKYKERRLRGN